MSSASVSPHGFGAVRGRGYRPEQVDAYAAALSRDRDAAWERAARLTVLAREMETEVAELRETVAQLPPQTYETLGEGARRLFQLAQEEAGAVREGAGLEAQRLSEAAQARATGVRDAAQAHADAVRADAEERARHRLLAARAEADEIRISTRREVKEGRGEALGALREVRRRTSAMLAEQAKEFAERWEEFERVEAERVAAAEGRRPNGWRWPRRRCPRRNRRSRRRRSPRAGARRRRTPVPPRWWREPGCGRSGSRGRRSGC